MAAESLWHRHLDWFDLRLELTCRPAVLYAYYTEDPGDSPPHPMDDSKPGHMVLIRSVGIRNSQNVSYLRDVGIGPGYWLEIYDPSPIVDKIQQTCKARRIAVRYWDYLNTHPWVTYYRFNLGRIAAVACPLDTLPGCGDNLLGKDRQYQLDSATVFEMANPEFVGIESATAAEAVQSFLPTISIRIRASYDRVLEDEDWLLDAAGLEGDVAESCEIESPIDREILSLGRLRTSGDDDDLNALVRSRSKKLFLCRTIDGGFFTIEATRWKNRWHVSTVGDRELAEAIGFAREIAGQKVWQTTKEVYVPGLNVTFLRLQSTEGEGVIFPLSPMGQFGATYRPEDEIAPLPERPVLDRLRAAAREFRAHGPS